MNYTTLEHVPPFTALSQPTIIHLKIFHGKVKSPHYLIHDADLPNEERLRCGGCHAFFAFL